MLRLVVADPATTLRSLVDSGKQRSAGVKRTVQPRSINQRKYVEAIEQNDMVFGVGPAGTGKTYLAVAMAVAAMNAKKVSRIVLVRPAVEAGEKLGFLPGSLQEKVDPYLRPLYDALYDLLDPEKVDKMLEKNVIEVAPLAFMRGRTLNDAFIIMDEAQNTTIEQMKMFLTRMGNNSKAVITGDITQIDLPNPRKSGLMDAINMLDGVEGIRFCHFEDADVVRHALVQRIVRAYECGQAAAAGTAAEHGRWARRAGRGARACAQQRIRPSRSRERSRKIRVDTGLASSEAPCTMILLDPDLDPDTARLAILAQAVEEDFLAAQLRSAANACPRRAHSTGFCDEAQACGEVAGAGHGAADDRCRDPASESAISGKGQGDGCAFVSSRGANCSGDGWRFGHQHADGPATGAAAGAFAGDGDSRC